MLFIRIRIHMSLPLMSRAFHLFLFKTILFAFNQVPTKVPCQLIPVDITGLRYRYDMFIYLTFQSSSQLQSERCVH